MQASALSVTAITVRELVKLCERYYERCYRKV